MCSCIGNVYVLDPKKLCLGNVANVYVLANVSVVEAKKCIEVLETCMCWKRRSYLSVLET